MDVVTQGGLAGGDLKALSDAATPGEWRASPYRGALGSQVWAGEPGPNTILILGDGDTNIDADAALIVALVNAYRAGELVPRSAIDAAEARQREADAVLAEDRYLQTDWQEPGQCIATAIRKGTNWT